MQIEMIAGFVLLYILCYTIRVEILNAAIILVSMYIVFRVYNTITILTTPPVFLPNPFSGGVFQL